MTPPWLAEGSYWTTMGLHSAFFEELSSVLQPSDLMALRQTVFVMWKPDAVLSGLVPAMTNALGSIGKVIHFEIIYGARAAQFEELYKFNLTRMNNQNMLGLWWLNRRVYEMGPVITLLIRITPQPERTAHQIVANFKGPSNPATGQAGQLRYDFEACNRSINLLHAADDPISTAREFLLFHSSKTLVKALRCSAEITMEIIAEKLLGLSGTSRVSLDLPRLLRALVVRLASLCRAEGFALPDLGPIHYACDETGGHAARTQATLVTLASLYTSLPSGCSPALAVLRDLSNVKAYQVSHGERIVASLAAIQLPLDSWEELLLLTSMAYVDDTLGCSV